MARGLATNLIATQFFAFFFKTGAVIDFKEAREALEYFWCKLPAKNRRENAEWEWESWWCEVKRFQPLFVPVISLPKRKAYRKVLGKAHQDIWEDKIRYNLPVLHGPAQDRRWVEWLKEQIHLVEN